MSLEQSEAIVLRTTAWSETSLVVSLYTREFGKLSLLAKGARRPKSPFEAALDLMSICRVVFISKSSEALDILTEAKLERRFRAGSWDLLRLNCGYYAIELLDRLTEKGDEQPEIFDLARDTLTSLEDQRCEPRSVVLRMELGLLRMIGNLPSWRDCVQCGTPVQSPDWITFGVTAGGVLCAKCQTGARNTLRIPTSIRDLMELFSQPEWRSIGVTMRGTDPVAIDTYPEKHRAAIRALVNRCLTTLLDRKFQLHAFLEELGR